MRPERLLVVGEAARTAAMVADRGYAFACTPQQLAAAHADDLAGDGFDAALLLLEPGQSPHGLGYLLYLAGVPVRVGRSGEFGGSALSTCLPADASDADLVAALDAAQAPTE